MAVPRTRSEATIASVSPGTSWIDRQKLRRDKPIAVETFAKPRQLVYTA
jgi:hypothetical protein